MAFKFVIMCSMLVFANAGFIEQPVAHYSSAPSVSSVSYSAPVATKTVSYAAQPAAVISHQPVHYAQQAYAQPAYAKTVATYSHAPAISHYGYEHGSSEQNIVRSAHGTVSHISKHVDTPHSSVRKYDTRITNDYPSYKVAVAQPVVHSYAQPEYHTYAHSAPVVTKTVSTPVHTYAQPAVVKTVAAPVYHQPAVHHYAHETPVTYTHSQPAAVVKTVAAPTVYHQAPVHTTYAHQAPVLKSAVQYSPAVAVSHASFEGLGAHYAW